MVNELHYCLLGFTPRRSFLLHSVNPTLDCITGCGNMTRPPLTAGPSHHTPSTSSTPQLMSLPVMSVPVHVHLIHSVRSPLFLSLVNVIVPDEVAELLEAASSMSPSGSAPAVR